MLINFRSTASADILMMSNNALELLHVIGRKYAEMPEEGVITVEQLDEAIAKLSGAASVDAAADQGANQGYDAEHKHDITSGGVSFHQRAFPLLEMLKTAKEHDHPVVWNTSRAW